MSVELKPCPWCGEHAVVDIFGGRDERNGYNFSVSIVCTKCSAKLTRASGSDENGWCNEPAASVTARAIESWNTRHGAGDAKDLEQFRAAVLSWKDDVEWLTWTNCGESAIEAQKQVDEANRLIGLIDAQKAARAGERG